jgi:hypothetical protein
MQDHAIVARVDVVAMRQPVAGAQLRLDVAEQARAILGCERGVAEVWTRATSAPPSKIRR